MAETIEVTPPAQEPVTLAEARAYLRIDDDNTSEDALVQALIKAAREQAEFETGRRLITQVHDMVLDAFPAAGESIVLHSGLFPAQEIVHIQYLDRSGVVQTFGSSNYALDPHNAPGYVFPVAGASWPSDVAESANAVRVRVRCGMSDGPDGVPAPIRQWMLLQIGSMYRNREGFAQGVSVAELPNRFTDRMLDRFRVLNF